MITMDLLIRMFLALAASADQQGSPLIQLIPFALVLAIFYFVILLPMKKRQKKVQEFLDALKVGDKVVTSGGIYGSITKLSERCRAAAGRPERPARRVAQRHRRLSGAGARRRCAERIELMAKNLRWKLLIILGVIALSVFAFYPPGQKVHLGLDLKGGVHLVMRVQTDDAVRLETQTTADRLREQLKTAEHPGGDGDVVGPTEFTVDGVPPDQDAGVPARSRSTELDVNYDRSSGAGGLHLHDAGRTSPCSCAKTR